jgi:UDP-glucuronate decarboxylase
MDMRYTTFRGGIVGAELRLPDRPSRLRKRILVTGGAGFLGSHLCERLIGDDHVVVALDSFQTGVPDNLAHLADSGRLKVVQHDIVEPLPDTLPRFDEIYNLACPASPVHYQSDPVKTLSTCSTGVLNVLKRAERDGARLLQASTSEVYGDPEIHPQHETYWGNVNPIGPRACYDEGKRFAEALMTDYARSTGIELRIARIFNTYGPRMRPDDGRVVSNFAVQALRGDDITVYGDGSQTRSFCFVGDLVDGLVGLMEASEIDRPVNLGNPDEIAVSTLASRIVQLANSTSRIVYRPLPTDDPRQRRPDIGLARMLLGWEPRVDRDAGLRVTIDYFARRIGRVQRAPTLLAPLGQA